MNTTITFKNILKIGLFWVGFGLFSIFSSYVYYEGTEHAFEWMKQLPLRMPSYLLWVFFTPFLFRFADRFTWQPEKPARYLLTGGAALLAAMLHRFTAYFTIFHIKQILQPEAITLFSSLYKEFFFILSAVFDSFFIACGILIYRYSTNYYRQAMESKLLAEKLRNDLQSAKLNTLQSHIQPHFLFNTLHAISSMVYTNPEKADSAITILSGMLRRSLDLRDDCFVSLQEEFALCRQYTQIQKFRFEDKLAVEFHPAPDTVSIKIPAFLLQPILENITKHSLEKSSVPVRVAIASEINGGELVISVWESGGGFSDLSTVTGNGFGLQNVLDRLANLPYKAGKLLTEQHKAGGGFTITIIIPVAD